jgi:hypothetical protein
VNTKKKVRKFEFDWLQEMFNERDTEEMEKEDIQKKKKTTNQKAPLKQQKRLLKVIFVM